MNLCSTLGKGGSIPYFNSPQLCVMFWGAGETKVVTELGVFVVVVLNGPGNVVSLRSSNCRLGQKLNSGQLEGSQDTHETDHPLAGDGWSTSENSEGLGEVIKADVTVYLRWVKEISSWISTSLWKTYLFKVLTLHILSCNWELSFLTALGLNIGHFAHGNNWVQYCMTKVLLCTSESRR